LKQKEEAEKRDHKKLGKEMDVHHFRTCRQRSADVPAESNIIRTELENFIRHEKEMLGYSFVTIPHIAKKSFTFAPDISANTTL